MESYVEITWLGNGLLICFSGLLCAMVFSYPLAKHRLLIISFLYTIYLMLVADTWWLIVVGEVTYGYAMFRHNYQASLVSLAIRLLSVGSLHLFGSQSSSGLIWYVPQGQEHLVSLAAILFIMFLICVPRLSVYFIKTKYRYPVIITIGDIVITGNGYLDSGNIATHQNKPIIFISRATTPTNWLTQLQAKPQTKVTIRSLHASQVMECVGAKLQIPGYLEREVLVGMMDECNVKRGCDILLNAKVFQVH